jgi:Phosphoesterase family
VPTQPAPRPQRPVVATSARPASPRRRGRRRAAAEILPILGAIGVTLVLIGAWAVYWSAGPPPAPSPGAAAGGEPTVRSAAGGSDNSTVPTSLPPFSSGPGDTIVVWVSQSGRSGVANVTDSAGDLFRPVLASSMAFGSTGAVNGLSVWIATGVAGGPAVTVEVTEEPACGTCIIDSAIVAVDATGLGPEPIAHIGNATNSSTFAGEQSNGFSCSVSAGPLDLVLAGVAARNFDNLAPAGGDALVFLQVTGPPISPRTTTTAVFQETEAVGARTVWMNGTDNQSSAWVAAAIALAPTSSPQPADFSVTFTENGLPSGTSWSVSLGGQTSSAAAPSSIAFSVPDGTYPYEAATVVGYTQGPASGTVLVNGAPETISIYYASSSRPIQHVVVIVLENEGLGAAFAGSAYLRYLSGTYGNFTQFYAACHGSLPDYTALTSGRYYACGSDSISETTDENVGDLLERNGDSWAGYFEGMTVPCDPADGGGYVTDHNPFLIYQDVVGNQSRCDSHVVNSAAFNESLANGTLPTVSLYIPNEYDDCESSSIAYCSTWLSDFLGGILNSTSPTVQAVVAHTAFIVVFDEGSDDSGYAQAGYVNSWCEGQTGNPLSDCGGHTYLTVVSPYSVGTVYTAMASDYNVLSTIEWLFGLGSDGGWDGTAAFPSLSGIFSFTSN